MEFAPSMMTWTGASRPGQKVPGEVAGDDDGRPDPLLAHQEVDLPPVGGPGDDVEILGPSEVPGQVPAGRGPVLVAEGQGDMLDVEVQGEAEHDQKKRRKAEQKDRGSGDPGRSAGAPSG